MKGRNNHWDLETERLCGEPPSLLHLLSEEQLSNSEETKGITFHLLLVLPIGQVQEEARGQKILFVDFR